MCVFRGILLNVFIPNINKFQIYTSALIFKHTESRSSHDVTNFAFDFRSFIIDGENGSIPTEVRSES